MRQALSLGCDRETIVRALYGRGAQVGVNLLYNPPQFESKANTVEFNLDRANALLDEAGWRRNGRYREKDGVQLAVLYQTTANTLRQKTQEIIKDAWEKLGVKTELKGVDPSVFLSSQAGNPDTAEHFYADVQMYRSSNTSPDPQSFMRHFLGTDIAQKANNWTGANRSRYRNPEYDRLWEQARVELDQQRRAELFVRMNDIAVQDVVHIPLVYPTNAYARARNLQNINFTPWEPQYWNIANWIRQG